MFRTAAGGITHGSTAHFKEPFLHILQDTIEVALRWNPFTYGNVKDMSDPQHAAKTTHQKPWNDLKL